MKLKFKVEPYQTNAVEFVGVDGYKSGWISVGQTQGGKFVAKRFDSLDGLLASYIDAAVIAIDMPIGLLSEAQPGGRSCDIEARQTLGQPRGSSVFPAPTRQALEADTFKQANTANKESSKHQIGVSQQAFAIFPKLKEVDALIQQKSQSQVKEVHPELCFYEMNGENPLHVSKRKPEGKAIRKKLLAAHFPVDLDALIDIAASEPGVQEDDVLDALAALWTAWRISSGEAIRIPSEPNKDDLGLSMEIWR